MLDLIEVIRAAIEADASPETRAKGAAACRAILAALEPATSPPPQPNPPPIANVVAALRGVPPDQLLDLAIARLRAALPAGTEVPAAKPLSILLVPVPNPGVKP